mmetsp:Transcript_4273/g.6505  ORF Transcript_4273/g.6505 Transcript_4273/m.6505 type:complete len:82 (+) Transcript_4273:417-662(+)
MLAIVMETEHVPELGGYWQTMDPHVAWELVAHVAELDAMQELVESTVAAPHPLNPQTKVVIQIAHLVSSNQLQHAQAKVDS